MRFLEEITRVISLIAHKEKETILAASAVCADSIEKGRAVLLFGAGHSALPCQEAFPRIGSIVGFVQITEPSLGFNGFVTGKGGQKQMSFLEQTAGFAEVILSNYHLTKDDTLIVYSHSGINALPVEICALAKNLGVKTIGISSFVHSKANTPKNKLGKRLLEVADIAIDNHTPEGDALISLDEKVRVGGGSTVAHMVIMNSIVVETAAILHDRQVPYFLYPSHNVSENLEDMLEKEEALFEAHKRLLAKL